MIDVSISGLLITRLDTNTLRTFARLLNRGLGEKGQSEEGPACVGGGARGHRAVARLGAGETKISTFKTFSKIVAVTSPRSK